MTKVENEIKCPHCRQMQEVKETNVHQDINGKFIVCEICNSFINVEI